MGDGDIATGKLATPQALEKPGQFARRYIDSFIAPFDAMLGEPGAVDQGRAGMVDRMADDEGFDGQWRVSGANSRNAANSGSSGNPSMVK